MISQKLRKLLFGFYFLTIFFYFELCQSVPQYNQQDPYIIYSTKGSDKFFTKRDKMMVNLSFVPFYQHAHTVRDKDGHKVPIGLTYGVWNMLAPFFNISDMTPKTFNQTNYPNLYKSRTELIINGTDYSDPVNYEPDPMLPQVSFYNVNGDYEKLGLRFKAGLDLLCGIGMNVKTGFVDYKYAATFTPPTKPPDTDQPAYGLYNALLDPKSSYGIFKDLGLNVNEVRSTTFEDTHVELYWHIPFDFKEDNETVVTVAPYLSVGAWLPTSKKKDFNKAFSLSTGNNGHYGITMESSINFDFPGTVQVGVGCGVLLLSSEDYPEYRVPSDINQSGFYPWVTKVEVSPGSTWYFNASFKTENFIQDLSFYFDYIFTYHEQDKITINEPDSRRRSYFEVAKANLLENTKWKDQKFNFGFEYRITRQLSLGVAVQAHISGVRVLRTTTTLGSINFTF